MGSYILDMVTQCKTLTCPESCKDVHFLDVDHDCTFTNSTCDMALMFC